MFKKFTRFLILTFSSNLLIVKILLIIDNYIYKIVSQSSVIINKGIHPKHAIIKYNQWFEKNLKKNWVVLDIGCGHGHLTKYLSNYCKKIIGIEIVKKDYEKAKKINQSSNITYINADATLYDYDNLEKIDCIVLSNVLEHIKERNNFFKIINKKIKKKYTILIRVPAIERDWYAVYKKNLGIDYRLDSTHYIEYTKKELIKEIESFGLFLESLEMNFGEFYAICKKK